MRIHRRLGGAVRGKNQPTAGWKSRDDAFILACDASVPDAGSKVVRDDRAMQKVLTSAIELHQGGRLGEAAALYQEILAHERENAEALHLLGVVHHQQGDHAKAIELIGRAVALRPSVPAFHANLAEAYRATGQWDRAAGCCRAALNLRPDYPEALCNLGLALQGQGKRAEAIDQFRRALQLRPDLAAAHNNLGIALREVDQFEEALEHFRRAVELQPNFAPARTNLGQILLDRGRAEEALPHCQEAVRLQPNLAALHHNLGNALRALERYVDARAAYLEALRLEPDLAPAHAHLGLTLSREGRHGDALPWLKRAVELDPTSTTFEEFLAELYMEQEEPAAAIPHWERALALADGRRAGLHLSLGWAYQEEGRLAEAQQQFEAALRLQPDLASAHLNLGGLHEERGELAKAEEAFRTALRVQPNFALPHARLATLLRGKLPDEGLAALEQRLADPGLDRGPRARLLFGLAHVLDARGDYARAAECLREANAISRELAEGRKDYEPAEHERFVTKLLEAFDAGFFARAAGLGHDSRRPVFVFGLPRSGTTLIEQVLASHSHVHGAGELRLARASFEGIPAALDRPGPPIDGIPDLDARSLRRLAEQHLERLGALAGDAAERVADKMPDNYMYVGLLAAMFPHATFIHCRRDLRDVAVSCWMTDFRSIRWANHPEHIASRFHQYRGLMDHWARVLPVPVLHVDYEETVSDLESVARRLVAACGLGWEPACLEFHRTERPIRTASVTQVRQPVYQRSVARWKNYQDDLADLFAALTGDGRVAGASEGKEPAAAP
jgi:tetratricopeptide (TPR) repeat protein